MEQQVNPSAEKRLAITQKKFVEKKPLGIDILELSMLRALEKEGIEVVDGQQAMLDARKVKTADETELLKQAAAMVDAVYEDIARAIRPGTRENELVAFNGYHTCYYRTFICGMPNKYQIKQITLRNNGMTQNSENSSNKCLTNVGEVIYVNNYLRV